MNRHESIHYSFIFGFLSSKIIMLIIDAYLYFSQVIAMFSPHLFQNAVSHVHEHVPVSESISMLPRCKQAQVSTTT